jgi:hypothetical protein
MSKAEAIAQEIAGEKKRVVINFSDAPILSELDFESLVAEHQAAHKREKKAESEKKEAASCLRTALEAAHADTVLYDLGKKHLQVLLVTSEPGKKKLDDALFMSNLMKIGKISATLLAMIIEASEVPAAPKESYVTIKTAAKA